MEDIDLTVLRESATQLVETCTDAALLDLICKLLIENEAEDRCFSSSSRK